MAEALQNVMDALDVETFLVCQSEDEGRNLALGLMKSLGFQDVDIVFIQFRGPGVRVRSRAYINRAGDKYSWLLEGKGDAQNG